MKKKSRITLIIVAVILFLGGAILTFLPQIKTAIFEFEGHLEIKEFTAYVEKQQQEQSQKQTIEHGEQPRIFPDLWDACIAYNEQIFAEKQEHLNQSTMNEAPFDVSVYGWTEDSFGYLEIPTIDIKSPVYLGTKHANLLKGLSLAGQTSMPTGGINTNCVIAGHRAWKGTVQLEDLKNLQEGDMMYLTTPWERMSYMVVSVKTVKKNDNELVRIVDGKDLLTVFTCTNPNTHRVVVTCERQPSMVVSDANSLQN